MMRNPVVILLSSALLSSLGLIHSEARTKPMCNLFKIGLVALQVLLWLGFLVMFNLVSTLLMVLHLRCSPVGPAKKGTGK